MNPYCTQPLVGEGKKKSCLWVPAVWGAILYFTFYAELCGRFVIHAHVTTSIFYPHPFQFFFFLNCHDSNACSTSIVCHFFNTYIMYFIRGRRHSLSTSFNQTFSDGKQLASLQPLLPCRGDSYAAVTSIRTTVVWQWRPDVHWQIHYLLSRWDRRVAFLTSYPVLHRGACEVYILSLDLTRAAFKLNWEKW